VNTLLKRFKTSLVLVLGVIFLSTSCRYDQAEILPGTYTRSIELDGWARTYQLFVPDCYSGDEQLPLVMMFHGGGGSARGVALDTGWSEKAAEQCFLVVYPEALPEDRDKRASFTGNPRLWNDGSGRFNQDIDDIVYIRGLLDSLEEELNIDPDRIFGVGFSNGASMAFLTAIELNDRIAAVAPVAGALWVNDFQLEEPVSLLYLTGTEDPLNPMEGGAPELLRGDSQPGGGQIKPPVLNHINSWVKALDCTITPYTIIETDWIIGIGFQDCDVGTVVHYYTLPGVGHHWPGGKIRLPEYYVGKATDTVSATDLIWDFFSAHPKP
jgi:polyhydroxybutyrate depolymerase